MVLDFGFIFFFVGEGYEMGNVIKSEIGGLNWNKYMFINVIEI